MTTPDPIVAALAAALHVKGVGVVADYTCQSSRADTYEECDARDWHVLNAEELWAAGGDAISAAVLAGVREQVEAELREADHLIANFLHNEDGEDDEWLEQARDHLNAAVLSLLGSQEARDGD